MQGFHAVIFDLDGTLLDTLEDLAEAGNNALKQFGYPVHPVEAYRKFVGSGLETLVQRALPPETCQSILPDVFQELVRVAGDYYAHHWACHTQPYAGIREVLVSLQQQEIPVAVVTNKPHAWSLDMLSHFFPDIPFSFVQGAAPGIPHKPDPFSALRASREMAVPPHCTAFIGDSDVDVLTAHNAGMGAFGATWGFRGPEELEKAGADVLLTGPLELLPYLLRR